MVKFSLHQKRASYGESIPRVSYVNKAILQIIPSRHIHAGDKGHRGSASGVNIGP